MKSLVKIFIVLLFPLAIIGYFKYAGKNTDQNLALLNSPEPSESAAANSEVSGGLKTFTFNSFHGSTDISDKFSFQYPASWYNDGQYFSPHKIQYYDQFTANAPIYYDLMLVDIFDQTEFKYQIDNSKRRNPDSAGQIDGKTFKRYDLNDYGSYGGESAGRVKIFVGPKIKIDGDDYYLVFHWEEKPLAEAMPGNDIKVFDDLLLSLKFNR